MCHYQQTLEMYVTTQNHTNVSLHEEVAELKEEYVIGYGDKIAKLEEQLRTVRPSVEQQQILEQMSSHVSCSGFFLLILLIACICL